MGFFDFIKRFIGEEKEVEKEKLALEDINKWVLNKKGEFDSKNAQFLELMGARIGRFREEVGEKIIILDEVDVDAIKSEEKIKLVVRENFAKYIEHVKRFRERLNNLAKNNAVNLVKDFEELFSNFQKKSSLNFQKSTILIGKELGDMRDCIADFVKDIDKIVKEHKDYFEKTQVLARIEKRLGEKEKIHGVKSEIVKSISDKGIKIGEIEAEIEEIKRKIDGVKNTTEYIEKEKEKQEIEEIKNNLGGEINSLREMIDFKELSNFFHISEKSMEIIKAHKDNFRESFEKDYGLEIIRLLEESKLIKNGIKDKTNKIIEMRKKVEEFVYENKEIKNLKEELRDNQKYIGSLIEEKKKEDKKIGKFEENIRELDDLIKSDFEKIGVEVA